MERYKTEGWIKYWKGGTRDKRGKKEGEETVTKGKEGRQDGDRGRKGKIRKKLKWNIDVEKDIKKKKNRNKKKQVNRTREIIVKVRN